MINVIQSTSDIDKIKNNVLPQLNERLNLINDKVNMLQSGFKRETTKKLENIEAKLDRILSWKPTVEGALEEVKAMLTSSQSFLKKISGTVNTQNE